MLGWFLPFFFILGVAATLWQWGELIYCTLMRWTCWIVDLFLFELRVWGFFEALLDELPDELPAALESLMVFYQGVNYWLPLTEAITLYTAYAVFLAGVLVIRTLFRFIPTM